MANKKKTTNKAKVNKVDKSGVTISKKVGGKRVKAKFPWWLVALILVLVAALAIGGVIYLRKTDADSKNKSSSSSSGLNTSSSSSNTSSSTTGTGSFDSISFHFLTLGNQYNGDSIYIKAGENDILIDAGSRKGSESAIKSQIDQYCTDSKLEYVIATHSDQDHIAAFVGNSSNGEKQGILYSYDIDTLIDFDNVTKKKSDNPSQIYTDYLTARDNAISKGTKHYTGNQCFKGLDGASRVYTLGNGLTMEILYQKYYEEVSSNENNHSVALLFKQGEKKMLFTGDLEDDGCDSLLESNDLGTVDLFKAGHHGSFNANGTSFIDAIQPNTIVCSCVAGSNEYTANNDNTMPYQNSINAWAKWTDDVYVTRYDSAPSGESGKISKDAIKDLNGTVIVNYDQSGTKTISCSASNEKLKSSDWMKTYRQMPSNWA